MKSFEKYTSFGMLMPQRNWNESDYRFAYQGSERDREITNTGDIYTTYFRELDTRRGQWWGIDPKASPWQSPYVSMGNNPILFNDIFGDTIRIQGVTEDIADDSPELREDFTNMIKNELGNKVNVSYSYSVNSNEGLLDIDIALKEGESFTEEEQIRFDYLMSLNTSPDDFIIGLSRKGEFSKELRGFFFIKDFESSYQEKPFDVVFNLDNVKSTEGGPINIFYLGLTKGDVKLYNFGSSVNLKNIKDSDIQLKSYKQGEYSSGAYSAVYTSKFIVTYNKKSLMGLGKMKNRDQTIKYKIKEPYN